MRIQRNSELAWREVGGETIVIHLGRKMMYGLNPAGGRIWAALDGGATMEELESALPAEVGSEEAVRAAVRTFLADLAAEDLVGTEAALPGTAETADTTTRSARLPRIAWREEVRRFAGACAKFPGVSVICDQNPQMS